MAMALIGFILSWGLFVLALAVLHPDSKTESAKNIGNAAVLPIGISVVWVLVEFVKYIPKEGW